MNKTAVIFTLLIAQLFSKDYTISTGDTSSIDVKMNKIIMSEAYKAVGITPQYKQIPFARSINMTQDGSYDAELFRNPIIEKSHPNLIRVNVPLRSIPIYVAATDSSNLINSWDEIGDRRVIILRGVKYVKKKTEGMRVTEVNTWKHGLFILENHRADIALLTMPLQVSDSSKLIVMKEPLDIIETYHYLNEENRHLKERLENQLIHMRENGRVRFIQDSVIQSHRKQFSR